MMLPYRQCTVLHFTTLQQSTGQLPRQEVVGALTVRGIVGCFRIGSALFCSLQS